MTAYTLMTNQIPDFIIRDIKTVNGPKPGDEGDRHRRAIYDELQLALYAKAWESAYPKDVVVGVGISEVGATTKHYVKNRS